MTRSISQRDRVAQLRRQQETRRTNPNRIISSSLDKPAKSSSSEAVFGPRATSNMNTTGTGAVFGPRATSNPDNPTQPIYNSRSVNSNSESPPPTSPMQPNSSGGNFGAPPPMSNMTNITAPAGQQPQIPMQEQQQKPNGFKEFLNDPLGTIAALPGKLGANTPEMTKQPGEIGFNAQDLISAGTGITAINSAAIHAASQLRTQQATQLKDSVGMTRAEEIIRKNELSKEGSRRLLLSLEKQGEQILNGNLAKESLKAANGISTASVPVGQAAVNSATTASKVNFLKKFFSNSKNIKAVVAFAAGWLMTGGFAYNELNDAITSKGFALDDAIDAKDYEFAEQLREEMEDLNKYNELWFILGGTYSYYVAATNKGKGATKDAARKIANSKERDLEKAQLEQKDIDGTMTDEERAHYIELYPYSLIAQEYISSKKNLDAQGNPIYGDVDPETGEYIPSNIEEAKAEYKEETENRDALGNPLYGSVNENGVYVPSYTELAKRMESQQYYNSLSGGTGGSGGGVDQNWQPPASLNFGLLKTTGGYEIAPKTEGSNQQFVGAEENDDIANWMYGVPYAQLPPEAQQAINKLTGG